MEEKEFFFYYYLKLGFGFWSGLDDPFQLLLLLLLLLLLFYSFESFLHQP